MSADTEASRLLISLVAAKIGEEPNPDTHALLILSGAAHFLTNRHGVAYVANLLDQYSAAYSDQIVPGWKPPARAPT